MSSAGTFLYLDRFDVARDRRETFGPVHEGEVLPRMRGVRGVLRAGLYQTESRRDPRYLSVFELADAGVPGGAEWNSAVEQTPWRERISPFVMNRQDRLYRKIGGDRGLAYGTRYLLCVSVDVEPHKESLMNELYDAEHIPALKQLAGIASVVRYKALQGNPGYLAIYEIERPEIPASKEWAVASDTGRWRTEVKPYLYNAGFVVYEILGGDARAP